MSRTRSFSCYNNHKTHHEVRRTTYHILTIITLLCLCSCASQRKNNATARAYHAFTARYNTYYNGNVSYNEGLKAQASAHKDNYLEQLPLLIIESKETQKSGVSNYDRAIDKSQKAIKNHSIKTRPKRPAGKKLTEKQKRFYAKKEFNPFLWQAWFLMANSQFQKGEFAEAASTYLYISKLYENDPKIVAKARIGLAKCYTGMGWLYESEDLLQRAQRDSIPKSLHAEFAVAKANLLLKQGRGEEAIPYIKEGMERKGMTALEKAREHYLIGQLYTKAGNKQEAYKHFGKTISMSPPYEFEFNARIRQTETAVDENHSKILRKLKNMAKSPKNEEYQSQIYYAIGNLHLSNKDTAEAVKAYETGIALGASSGYGTGLTHLALARIYWGMGKFSKSHDNYSKALSMVGEESEDYDEVKTRSEVLGGIIQYTDIIEKQSELLLWASLPQKKLDAIIEERIEEAKFYEELNKEKEKKMEQNAGGSALDQAGMAASMTIQGQNEKQKWYFYNPQLVSQGINTFKQKWGNRELKDYWRFSHEISSLMSNTTPADSLSMDSIDMETEVEENDMAMSDSTGVATEAEALSTDPTTKEFYLQQIPDTEEEKQAAHAALSAALFEAGIRFKDEMNDKGLTLTNLERIVEEYPDHEKLAETYYQLFLACSRWDEPEKADMYKRLLTSQFPDSSMTERIKDPYFFESAAERKHREDSLYVEAYGHYLAKEYDKVIRENEYSAGRYPNGSHRARFMFIDAMSKLYNNRHEDALKAIEELVATYSSDSISTIASSIAGGIKEGRLLNSDISLSIWDRKSDGTIKSETDTVIPQFSNDRDEAYYFVLAFPNGSLDEKQLLFEIARYNFSRYMVRNFELSFVPLAEVTLLEVKEFINFDEAFVYRKRLYTNATTAKLLEGINSFVISKTNLDLLLEHYTFGDYMKFYEENFLAIPEVEIDGYTLDEPDYEVKENRARRKNNKKD